MVKVTQFKRLLPQFPSVQIDLVHTGQHYDHQMAQIFFEQFDMRPDHSIKLKARNSAAQIGEMMMELNSHFEQTRPDLVLVPGDVNSTLAASLAAYKMSIPVGHIESGLRSFDRTMPEELNRILTDQITDIFFVTEPSGLDNLLEEGKPKSQIHFVGNTMIDTLVYFDDMIESSTILQNLDVKEDSFALLTFHRPSNVASKTSLHRLVSLIKRLVGAMKCVFPVHPRTQKALKKEGLLSDLESTSGLILTGPLGYFEFQKLIKYSKVVVTDSGGIQEETTYRRVPCITLRPNTERPITTSVGSNILLPFDIDLVLGQLGRLNEVREGALIPELWDGKASYRILKAIQDVKV